MEKPYSHIAEEITDHIKKEILTAVPTQIDQLSSENIELLRSKLHILRYYCLQKGFDTDIISRLDTMLETSQGFWELLEDNANTLVDLKETYKMRRLDLSSALLTATEEIMSGEESFRDIIVDAIALFIGWKADTIWVDMAEKDHGLISKVHTLKLREELWRFITELSRNGSELTLEKAAEIGEKMDLLLRFINDDNIPVAARVVFLSQVYILLLRLSISKIILVLKSMGAVPQEDNGS